MTLIIIRKMTNHDATRMAEIHLQAFQGFFLSLLGAPFLQVMYRSILADPGGIALVAEDEGELSGFVAGSTQFSGFFKKQLLKHPFQYSWSLVIPILRKPAILRRILRTLTAPGQELAMKNCTTLMSIAVDPDYQGKGIGKMLVGAFVTEANARGAEAVNLNTDAINNDAVNKFYLTLGFQPVRQYTTPEGRTMNEYMLSLTRS